MVVFADYDLGGEDINRIYNQIKGLDNVKSVDKIKDMDNFTRAQEDFVEALLMLEEQGLPLETTKVARLLNVSKPAVHQMGHELIDKGLITRKDYDGSVYVNTVNPDLLATGSSDIPKNRAKT